MDSKARGITRRGLLVREGKGEEGRKSARVAKGMEMYPTIAELNAFYK